MYNFDFNETYLNESIFDDMFDNDEELIEDEQSLLKDIDNDIDNNESILKSVGKDLLKQLTDAFNNSLRISKYYDTKYNISISEDNTELYIRNKNSSGFSFDNTAYCNVDIQYIDEFNKFLLYAYQLGVEKIGNVLFHVENVKKSEDISNVIVDFQNILVDAVSLLNITPKNLVIDEYRDKSAYTLQGPRFNNCNLKYQDTFNIKAKYVTIINCINIRDYSFLSNNDKLLEFEVQYVTLANVPSTCNFTGLPEGNYKINVEIGPSGRYEINDLFNKENNFIGVPDTVHHIKFYAKHNPTVIMPWWTFEGLSDDIILNKLNTCISGFRGRKGGIIIQFGPSIIEPKTLQYSLTDPVRKYITSSHDYYIDCYNKSTGPNKEYKPSDELLNSKAYNNVNKQADKKKKQLEEQEEDFQRMNKLAKKILQEKQIYRSALNSQYIMRIEEIFDDKIKYTLSSRYRLHTYTSNWKEFFSFLKNNNFQTADGKEMLWNAISQPVINYRKRKKKKDREEAKLLRQLEKELQKQKEKEEKQNKKKEIINTAEVQQAVSNKIMGKKSKPVEEVPVSTTTDNSTLPIVHNGVRIVEYSDKSIALFGNTYPIKDLIKELGAKFNKFLKNPDNEDDKKPGWIISKSKLDDIKKILGI